MLVVADTSVLLNLCHITHDHLLLGLFREVQIPPAVHTEFNNHVQRHPRFHGLILPGWVRVSPVLTVPHAVAVCPDLDAGEREALALALQIRADAVLIDDEAGRLAALRLGLDFVGVAGILLRAKNASLIPEVGPLLYRLRTEALFWISPQFEAEVLRFAGEHA